jgi:lauroyl/myristoyl acyltransferase
VTLQQDDVARSMPVGLEDDDDLTARTVDAATPRPVPWGGLVAHLRASTAWRRVVPASLVMAATGVAVRLVVRLRPQRLERARLAMAAVVGGTPREQDLPRLTRRHLIVWPQAWETAWRPWHLRRMPVEGLDRLASVAPGRGVVLSTTHYGPPIAMAYLPRTVGPIYAAVGDHLFQSNPPGYDGHQNEHSRAMLTGGGWQLVRARGSADVFARVLRGGGFVSLSFDVPGSARVRFLGKTVGVKSGTARLAADTDSVVLPAAMVRRGSGWAVHIDEPIDPRDHPTWESVLQATADVHSRLVLAAPEYLESPLREGGWAAATADGWHAKAGS